MLYFLGLELGFPLRNSPHFPLQLPAGRAGQGGTVLNLDPQRARGPPPCPVPSEVSHPPTRPLSAPPPPAAQQHCPACRGQTIFPYESFRSLPDGLYILGSECLARHPHPISDVPCPRPALRPPFPQGYSTVRAQHPACAHASGAPSSTPAPEGAHLHPPHPGCVPLPPRVPRKRPRHPSSTTESPEHPEPPFKGRTPGTRRRLRHRGAPDAPKFGTYCLLLGPPLGRASGGRWPLRGAGAGGPQS